MPASMIGYLTLNISVSRVESIVAASILWAQSGPKERVKAPPDILHRAAGECNLTAWEQKNPPGFLFPGGFTDSRESDVRADQWRLSKVRVEFVPNIIVDKLAGALYRTMALHVLYRTVALRVLYRTLALKVTTPLVLPLRG